MIDFDSLLNAPLMRVLGETATYIRKAGGDPFTISAIGDESEESQIRTGGAFEVFVREVDFNGVRPEKGDQVLFGGIQYQVVDVRPNTTLPADEGGRSLELRKL